jgi:hypothetical protein
MQMLIISHDADFLEDIGMNTVVDVGRFRTTREKL